MKRLLADDSGLVMVTVMGAILVISLLAAGGYALASQSMFESTRMEKESKAFQIASSGMDRELATFSTSNFSASGSYPISGSTPDGTYSGTVGQNGPYMYTMTVTGTSGVEQATVEQNFFYMDLWAVSMAAGTSPTGGGFGSGSAWNGNSTIIGAFYVTGNIDFNSNVALYKGPPFASGGSVNFRGGVTTYTSGGEMYNIFASGGATGVDSNTRVYTSCPRIDLPWLDQAYVDGMYDEAVYQSSDNLQGTQTVGNAEVSTKYNPATYVGAKAPGATQYYKVINGPLVINSSTPAFGKSAGGYTDDFVWDPATGTLIVQGAVFVKGDITIGQGVQRYKGSGVLVAEEGNGGTGAITIATGGAFEPWNDNGNGVADDLSAQDCLALVAKGDISIRSSKFEGIAFTNKNFNLYRLGGIITTMEGPIHAHQINSDDPRNEIEMEEGMSPQSYMPSGVPGSSTDPRGPDYGGNGMVVPGTWIRRQ